MKKIKIIIAASTLILVQLNAMEKREDANNSYQNFFFTPTTHAADRKFVGLIIFHIYSTKKLPQDLAHHNKFDCHEKLIKHAQALMEYNDKEDTHAIVLLKKYLTPANLPLYKKYLEHSRDKLIMREKLYAKQKNNHSLNIAPILNSLIKNNNRGKTLQELRQELENLKQNNFEQFYASLTKIIENNKQTQLLKQ